MKNWIKIHFECGNIIYNENNGQCPNDYFTPFQESSQDIILSSSKNASSIPIAALFLYVSQYQALSAAWEAPCSRATNSCRVGFRPLSESHFSQGNNVATAHTKRTRNVIGITTVQ